MHNNILVLHIQCTYYKYIIFLLDIRTYTYIPPVYYIKSSINRRPETTKYPKTIEIEIDDSFHRVNREMCN